jgi:hypothetical protein
MAGLQQLLQLGCYCALAAARLAAQHDQRHDGLTSYTEEGISAVCSAVVVECG